MNERMKFKFEVVPCLLVQSAFQPRSRTPAMRIANVARLLQWIISLNYSGVQPA